MRIYSKSTRKLTTQFICILETPGAAGQPQVTDITNSTVTLTWDRPASDGG